MAATLRLSPFLSTFTVTLLLQLFVLSLTETTNNGFTVDLIHRDSTLSPFYNSSQTRFDRLYNAFSRSISRANHIKRSLQSKSSIQSNIIASTSVLDYLMKISLGTPATEVFGVADTGSDLIWAKCEPCENCYKQNFPLFDPQQSSTYRNLSCKSIPCKALRNSSWCTNQNTCQYIYLYGDGSYTNGDLGVETLTIGSTSGHPVTIPRIVFGCGHNNNGTTAEAGSGVIGLGGGPLSLIFQLNKSISGTFSYCFIPSTENLNATSKINFGSNAMVSGNGVVSTPIVAKEGSTHYYLTLEGISIGSKRFAYKASSKAVAIEEGNIIIDSGTTLTQIPPEFFEDLVSALEKAIDAERVSDPSGVLSLCFKSKDDIDVPITAHFAGADVNLQPMINTFVRWVDDLVCFTMIPSNDSAIFGNLAQTNFFVGYDLRAKKVSFMPADCTKH
jgi:saccharopepsin